MDQADLGGTHARHAGTLTIDQVLALLEESVYHVLYRSCATHPMTEADLQALLDWLRIYNAHQLTDLLLYSDGRFMQLIEKPETVVQALYARIQQYLRHTQVVTMSGGPGSQRWFKEWSMAFGHVHATDLHPLTRAVAT